MECKRADEQAIAIKKLYDSPSLDQLYGQMTPAETVSLQSPVAAAMNNPQDEASPYEDREDDNADPGTSIEPGMSRMGFDIKEAVAQIASVEEKRQKKILMNQL